jgi:hypothetical protein
MPAGAGWKPGLLSSFALAFNSWRRNKGLSQLVQNKPLTRATLNTSANSDGFDLAHGEAG